MIPMSKNKVMIRVQNLNDEFDGVTEPLFVDMDALAKTFWDEMNAKASLKTYKVTEMSITGNMEASLME